MREVILDTNFLLVPFQLRIDILSEIERVLEEPHILLIPSGVVGELSNLQRNRGKIGRAANLGLSVVEKAKKDGRAREVESKGDVDAWIEKYAKENGAYVCTNDINLKKKLISGKVKVMLVRERGYLALV